MGLQAKYITRTTEIKTGKGTWSKLNVEILMAGPEGDYAVIGSYERNYSSIYNTFFPFEKNGKHYALYSKDYQATSVMSLPDCKHLGSTNDFDFCPVDYYVPDFTEFLEMKKFYEERIAKGDDKKHWAMSLEEWHKERALVGTKALVSGCVWGDDSGGWKVHMLDISDIENGNIKHLNSLGYFQLPNNGESLRDMANWDEPNELELPLGMRFRVEEERFSCHPVDDLPLRHYKGYDVELTETSKNRIPREDIMRLFDGIKPMLTELADMDRPGSERGPGKHEETARYALRKMDEMLTKSYEPVEKPTSEQIPENSPWEGFIKLFRL